MAWYWIFSKDERLLSLGEAEAPNRFLPTLLLASRERLPQQLKEITPEFDTVELASGIPPTFTLEEFEEFLRDAGFKFAEEEDFGLRIYFR